MQTTKSLSIDNRNLILRKYFRYVNKEQIPDNNNPNPLKVNEENDEIIQAFIDLVNYDDDRNDNQRDKRAEDKGESRDVEVTG